MQVSCPNCPWKGKASEKPTDRWVLCPKCKQKMLVRGTGMIVVPPEPPPIIKIPINSAHTDPEFRTESAPRNQTTKNTSGLIYQGERIRMFADGRVETAAWHNSKEAKMTEAEVKLALEEVKFALKILVEEQRQLNAKYTIRNRAVGPSLYRHSRKGIGSILYMAQLVGKAVISSDYSLQANELEVRRQVSTTVKLNLERILLEIKRYLSDNTYHA